MDLAEQKIVEAVEVAEQESKKEPKLTEAKEQVATYVHMMGYILAHKKSWEKAASCYKKSIELWQALNGEENKKLIALWSDSAKFFELKGDLEESLLLLEKCEKVIVAEKGKNSKDYSALLVAKAQVANHKKDNVEAERLFKEAISCVEGTAGQVAPTKA